MMPYPVTSIPVLLIGAVQAVVKPLHRKILLDLHPLQTQERPNHRTPDRLNRAKPLDPASPEKMKQHSLRPVVGIMCDGSQTALRSLTLSGKHLVKCMIPYLSARFLRRYSMRRRVSVHVRIMQIKGNLHSLTQLLHIRRIPRRFRPDAVVYMHSKKPVGDLLRQSPQDMQQTDGIRTA